MLTAFHPKGDVPEWRIIYDRLLTNADFGDLISYAALSHALGREFRRNRTPLYRARTELGSLRHRWLEAVPGRGYRVIEAREHLMVAAGHKRRARRQLTLMKRVADVTDLSRLTADELATYDQQTRINAALYMVAVHHERRIARIEQVLREAGQL